MGESKKSNTKAGLSGMLWNFSGSIVQIIAQLLVIGILSRLLTPEEFGIVAIIMIFVTFSELFTQMGIGTALVQLPNISKKHISLSYTLSILMGIIIGCLFYFIAPYIGTFFDVKNMDNAFRFFSIFFPLRSFSSIAYSLLTRNLKFSLLVKANMISYIFGNGLVSIILAYMNYGIWALILGQFAGTLINLAQMLYFERPSFSLKYDKKILKELLFFGSGHTLGTVFNYFAEYADNIIVGKTLGSVAMGVYSKAFQILAIPAKFFGSIFDKVIFPILAINQDKKEKLASFYLFVTSFCFSILLPISILIYINAELTVNLLLGPQWDNVILPMQLLILGLAFRFGTKINKLYLKSVGLVFQGAYYQFIFAVLMFSFCFLGGYFYDLAGVACGVFIATVLNYFQITYRLFKYLKFSFHIYSILLIKAFAYNIPFLIISIILFRSGLITSIWINFGICIFIYLPLIIYIFFNEKYIIFSEDNYAILSQIMNAFPDKIKRKLIKRKFLKKYYVK